MKPTTTARATIDREKLQNLLREEIKLYAERHPRSKQLFEKAREHLVGGLPMPWMARWGAFPLFVSEARNARFTDVDGHEYVDFCLGDTGAMTGHSPPQLVKTVDEQIKKGITYMLPTENAIWVAEELSRRFGLANWQFTLSATDANRFAIRIARHVTQRPYVLVFNWCYHGTVDESFATTDGDKVVARFGNLGPPVDPSQTTRVIEFNDVQALTNALKDQKVACVLAEPAMTNIGIVHPQAGFHDALRKATKDTGTLLILDETHTISASPGGCTQLYGLQPDMVTIGKPIGSGIPAAAYGMSKDVAGRLSEALSGDHCDTCGIGGTLAANALSMAAMRATLENILTPDAYSGMVAMADNFKTGVSDSIAELGLPWTVAQLGCRVEYWFMQDEPKNGSEAASHIDADLDRYMHIASLNRGVLMTPFHNMALLCPSTTQADVDKHTQVFHEIAGRLIS